MDATPDGGMVCARPDRRFRNFSPAGHLRGGHQYPARPDCGPLGRRPGRPGGPAQAGHGHPVIHGPGRLRLRLPGGVRPGGGLLRPGEGVAGLRLHPHFRRGPLHDPTPAASPHRQHRAPRGPGQRPGNQRVDYHQHPPHRPLLRRGAHRQPGLLLELHHRGPAVRRHGADVHSHADPLLPGKAVGPGPVASIGPEGRASGIFGARSGSSST